MSDTRTTSQDRHVSAGPAGNTVTRFIRRRPLTSWFIWAFTVGQALAFIPAIGALNGVEFLGSHWSTRASSAPPAWSDSRSRRS